MEHSILHSSFFIVEQLTQLTGYFKQLSLKAAPPQCRTVYGYQETQLGKLQAKFFPGMEKVEILLYTCFVAFNHLNSLPII